MKARDLRAGERIAVSRMAELNCGDAASELDFTVTPKHGETAELTSWDGWFPCELLDMSDQGFLLVCNKTLASGQILGLRCELYPEKTLECKVEIRHTDQSGTGVKIVEIDAKSVALCQLFLQEHYSDKLSKSG